MCFAHGCVSAANLGPGPQVLSSLQSLTTGSVGLSRMIDRGLIRMESVEEICTPGERLALSKDHDAGQGTYIRDGYICASLVGVKRTLAPLSTGQHPRVEVFRSGSQPVVPSPGDTVIARVVSITPRLAALDILCIGSKPVPHRYSGVIRTQDVRATEVDKVKLHECFRPGDIVRAEVLSRGDARSYYLTTAKNELGVVHARSLIGGEPMVPVSWQEMQCPRTRVVERRKVAKVA